MKNIDVEPIIEDLLEMKACGRECVKIKFSRFTGIALK